MLPSRRTGTRGLTGGAYELTASRGYMRPVALVIAAIVVIALAGGGVRFYLEHFAQDSRLAVLEERNRTLQADLDKARFELQVELATRSELERQLAGLNERLRQTEEELAFVKAAAARGPGG